MTRHLLLMRHAKSDWNDPSLGDKDRPLNARGRAAAPLLANWIITHHHLPDLVLCSTAIRTQQTLELLTQQWTLLQAENPKLVLPHVLLDDRLYLASDTTILAIAKDGANTHDSCQCVMVLGHNPGMEVLASKLSGKPVSMPTGAIAILASDSNDGEWPTDWVNEKMWKWRGLVKSRELGSETI